MTRSECIKKLTCNLSVPQNCFGCSHLSKKVCLLGFGVESHDFEDLNFFNIITGYHGLRNRKNACFHTDCQPRIENGKICGLVFEYMQKPGLVPQLNRDILRDDEPKLLQQGTLKGKVIQLYQGDASWWLGDALICPHGFTIQKVLGLCGIEDRFFTKGELPPISTGLWSASVHFLVSDVDTLISTVSDVASITSVCFTTHLHGIESVRRQISKLIVAFPNIEVIALCDYKKSNWVNWNMDNLIND